MWMELKVEGKTIYSPLTWLGNSYECIDLVGMIVVLTLKIIGNIVETLLWNVGKFTKKIYIKFHFVT